MATGSTSTSSGDKPSETADLSGDTPAPIGTTSSTSKPPKIRERRATAQVTPEQLFNERVGLEQSLVYAQTSGDSDAISSAESALSDHGRREAELEEEDRVVVGTANIDQNSAMTPRPESPVITDEEAAYPRGASQAPDLVYVPDPAAHTDAVQKANAEKAAQDRSAAEARESRQSSQERASSSEKSASDSDPTSTPASTPSTSTSGTSKPPTSSKS